MEGFKKDLDEAIQLINAGKLKLKQRDDCLERLSANLAGLDSLIRSSERRQLIVATQSTIKRLEHLFDKEKPLILLSDKPVSLRSYYLPDSDGSEKNHSLRALGTAFNS
jgi:hypothetical protein